MSDETDLLRAIAANSTEDAPRLAYADWLARRGDPRADYLRLASRLLRIPESDRALPDAIDQLVAMEASLDPQWVSAAGWECALRLESVASDKGAWAATVRSVRELMRFNLRDTIDLVNSAPVHLLRMPAGAALLARQTIENMEWGLSSPIDRFGLSSHRTLGEGKCALLRIRILAKIPPKAKWKAFTPEAAPGRFP